MTITEAQQLDRFTHADAWNVGRDLVERCRQESLGVTISIVLGSQRVFHAAMPGTSADNDAWVSRKIEIVRHFDRSSLEVYETYAKENPSFLRDFALPESRFTPAGGAVPIRVRGSLVGVLAISGLDSDSDHQMAVDALAHAASDGAGTLSVDARNAFHEKADVE